MLLFKCHGLFDKNNLSHWYQKFVDGMLVLTFFISNTRVTTFDILLTPVTIVDEDTLTHSCSIVFVLVSLA